MRLCNDVIVSAYLSSREKARIVDIYRPEADGLTKF